MLGIPSQSVIDLRLKSLHILRVLIESDDLVAVKLFKLKLLSNLLTHTLREGVSKSYLNKEAIQNEIKLIGLAFKGN